MLQRQQHYCIFFVLLFQAAPCFMAVFTACSSAKGSMNEFHRKLAEQSLKCVIHITIVALSGVLCTRGILCRICSYFTLMQKKYIYSILCCLNRSHDILIFLYLMLIYWQGPSLKCMTLTVLCFGWILAEGFHLSLLKASVST